MYAYGTSGRAVFGGPGKVNFDVSVHRDFAATERMQVQLRLEAFNVTNTPPLSNPGSGFGSTSFGVIGSAGAPRNVQLALKLLF